jgi:hypothetical protein
MSEQLLPAELWEFLETHIDSIAQLEALLLLRDAPGAAWDAKSIAKRLYVPEHEALRALAHLAGNGLIARDGDRFQFHPQSEGLSQGVVLLADYYRSHLISITNLVHSKPRRIQQFADAFKLKKD